MTLDLPSSNRHPLEVPGLPTLYASQGSWVSWSSSLPLPHMAAALRRPPGEWMRRVPVDIADDGGVPVEMENDDGEGDAPDSVMLDAARWLLANDAAVTRVVVDALVADLPRLLDIESSISLAGDAFRLPRHWDEATACSLVYLDCLQLPAVAGKAPYIGISLQCAWDDEHGYGLMLCGTDVVEIGGADVAALSWIAARHAEGRG